MLNLEENLTYYGIHYESYLDYITNLDLREELKTEVADLQNQGAILTLKVRDLQQKESYLDSARKAKKDKVDRLALEEKRLAIKIVEFQKTIEEAVSSDNVMPLLTTKSSEVKIQQNETN